MLFVPYSSFVMNRIAFVLLIASLLTVPAFAEPIVKASLLGNSQIAERLVPAEFKVPVNTNAAAVNLKLDEKSDLTKFGINLFRKTSSNSDSFTIRSGLSKLSTQAAASVELIVKW